MGEALKTMMPKVSQMQLTNSITFGLLGLEVTLPQPNIRVTDGLRFRPWLATRLVHSQTSTFLQAFRIGDTVWISTPCDFSGELALGIKDSMERRGHHAVVTSFNGDYVGYVIPARYYHLNGYEPRTMSFFGPNVPDYFDELIRALATDLVAE